jgi:hypothetical protein
VLNPIRSEREAFRLLVYVIVIFVIAMVLTVVIRAIF